MKTLLIVLFALSPTTLMAAPIHGTLTAKDGDILIISGYDSRTPYLAVTNYTGTNATVGRRISFDGTRAGVYDWGSTPVELWDASRPAPFNATAKAQEIARLETEIKGINAQIAALEAQRAVKLQRYNSLRGVQPLTTKP